MRITRLKKMQQRGGGKCLELCRTVMTIILLCVPAANTYRLIIGKLKNRSGGAQTLTSWVGLATIGRRRRRAKMMTMMKCSRTEEATRRRRFRRSIAIHEALVRNDIKTIIELYMGNN